VHDLPDAQAIKTCAHELVHVLLDTEENCACLVRCRRVWPLAKGFCVQTSTPLSSAPTGSFQVIRLGVIRRWPVGTATLIAAIKGRLGLPELHFAVEMFAGFADGNRDRRDDRLELLAAPVAEESRALRHPEHATFHPC
jgi:hypothetical protein